MGLKQNCLPDMRLKQNWKGRSLDHTDVTAASHTAHTHMYAVGSWPVPMKVAAKDEESEHDEILAPNRFTPGRMRVKL
eukprot:1157270-Pelagomonas_calceolata.AAC.15